MLVGFLWLGGIVFAGDDSDAPNPATTIEITGLILPQREETLSAPVMARVEAIHFDEGALVERGELIVELDHAMEKLNMERRAIAYQSDVAVRVARERARVANAEYEAALSLHESRRSVSREELNQMELESKLAEAEIEQVKLQKEMDRIEHAIAEQQVDLRRIRAPGEGIIAEIYPEIGEIAEPGEPLVRIIDTRSCYLECNVPTEIVANLEIDQEVRVEVPVGFERGEKTGRVEYIAPYVDPASGLRRVRVKIDNPDGKVVPGISGTLFVPGSDRLAAN